MGNFRSYFDKVEFLSSVTHLLFGIVSFFLFTVLLIKGINEKSVLKTVSYSIFGSSVILLYFSSGIYHLIPRLSPLKQFFRKIDHIMIFIMIAGSYTPFCLITLKGGWGWSIFSVVWSVALAGLFFKIFWINAPRILYTSIYLGMGWVVLVAIYPLVLKLNAPGVFWLFMGGLFYTVGAVIYAFKKPDPFPGIFGFHEIWHIFIILGTTSHFISVFLGT